MCLDLTPGAGNLLGLPFWGTVDFYNGSGQRQETGAFVRKFIAYVPQGNNLFSGTVRLPFTRLKLSET